LDRGNHMCISVHVHLLERLLQPMPLRYPPWTVFKGGIVRNHVHVMGSTISAELALRSHTLNSSDDFIVFGKARGNRKIYMLKMK